MDVRDGLAHYCRYVNRTSRRGHGETSVVIEQIRRVLAMAVGPRGLALVSQYANLPAAEGGRLGERN